MIFFNRIWKKSFVRYYKTSFGSLLFILFIGLETAQADNNFPFRHITSADGLTSNSVGPIMQDSRGFFWIGTEDGLNMYDGQSIKQYYLSDYIPSQANSNFIFGIAEDIDHNILIATKTGVIKFSWNTKQFTVAYKNPFIAFGNVNLDLFVDSKKNIWINEKVSIKEFDPHFHLLHIWNLRDSLSSKNLNGPGVIFIAGEDTQHNIWFSDSNLIYKINVITTRIDSSANHLLKNISPGYKECLSLNFSANSIWIIKNEHTLLHLNSSFQLQDTFQLSKEVVPFYIGIIEQNNKVWVATRFNGIFVIDIPSRQSQHYGENNALSSENMNGIFKDASENIWISTVAGVNEWKANASFFHQLTFHVPAFSISQRYVIQKAYLKNNTLFTFISNGVIRTQLPNNLSKYFFDYSPGYYSAAFPLDNKWLVSRHHNIEFLQFKNDLPVFSPFVSSHPFNTGVASFYQDHQSNIWIGLVNDGGIVCWDKNDNSFEVYTQKDTGKNYCPLRHFSYAVEDDYGNIWMGYDKGGVSIFDKKQNRFVTVPTGEKSYFANLSVSGMVNDHHGNLWISTNMGIIRYYETKNIYKQFTRKDGLPSNFVKSLTIDAYGNIWAGFEGALTEINISTNTIATYNSSDGLPDEDLQIPIYDTASGTMFFFTDRSVVYFNPGEVKKNFPSLNPVITSFEVMGKEQPIFSESKTELPYSQNYLSFTFSAPNYIDASENEYACKLDGVDKSWNYLGDQHVANYSQLQPGDYTFHVRARVAGGTWYETTTPIKISILKPFWLTTWFWVLCGLVVMLIVFAFVYIRLRNKFEKQVLSQTIRDKIAGDLHDDIGSTLSSITILSELAKQKSVEASPLLERISKNTSLMQENMSDIVWTINPKNDRFGNIIQRMSQFAAELLESKNIQVQFDSDESFSSLVLPMEKRKNFYLIFKEAINNCAKYSDASKVDIFLSNNDHTVSLIIADNGKGFDTEKNFNGNGMITMKKRAAELGGILKIDSFTNKGTTIKLDFKI